MIYGSTPEPLFYRSIVIRPQPFSICRYWSWAKTYCLLVFQHIALHGAGEDDEYILDLINSKIPELIK